MKALLLLAVLFISTESFSNTCNENCSTTSDCTTTTCAVCIGTCVSCYALGDSTSCADSGTGANTLCQWDGRNCKSITDVSEISQTTHRLAWYFLPLLCVLLLYRVNRIKS